ncbi:MAG TPA: dephospho-CoA kinase [Bacteroidales bacterium]|nr:dephospho-CoA kinase [Bacteroidales bacterium]
MIKIGITGTIGSGKSVVSKIFETMGISVYNADYQTKQIMIKNAKIISALKERYGDQVYNDSQINKAFLANIIFNNEDERKYVNSIVHPAVINDFIEWTKHQNEDIVAIESALIFESGIENIIDYSVLVTSPFKLAVERISKRDNISTHEAERKIELQTKNLPKDIRADFYIHNDENNSLIVQSVEILSKLRKE